MNKGVVEEMDGRVHTRSPSASAKTRRHGVRTKVLILSIGLLSATACGAFALTGPQQWTEPTAWPWWLAVVGLALMFAATEIFVVHLHIRGEAHTFSLVELPFALGLFFAPPFALIAAQLLGAGMALRFHRKQGPMKLLFNIASFAATDVVAIGLFRLMAGHRYPLNAVVLLQGGLALLAGAVLSVCLVFVVISLSTGTWRLTELRSGVRFGIVTSVFTVGLGVIAAIVVDAQPALAWLLIVPTGGIYLANWAYTTQRRRHEGLEFLYTSTKLLHESSELESGIVELLRHVRETFHSEAAELIYLPEASDSPLCVRVGPGALVESFDVLDDGHHLLIELLETRQAAILSSSSPVPGTDFLRRRGYDDALIAPLVGERRVVGGLVIANHMSEIMRFDANDTRLAQTLANHAAVALENGRLEQSLQQLRVLESRLTFQATHDPLTDLANRTLFRTHLTNALEDHGGLQGAVLFVDLDDFKTVNDSFGHASGDALLIEVGIRLKNCVRPSDTVARLGGDEFAVLLADVTQSVQANAAARRILDALEEPVSLRDRCIQIRASVGIAMIDTTTDPSVLMRNADTAMYTAKAQGKGRFVTFETAMHESTLHRFNLRTDLEKALRNNELVVHYQPIVDLGSNELVGAEALVRWDHPALGLVPPARFLGVATESGLVAAIDMVVLDVACAWLARTDGLDPGCVPWVAVNMSPLSFREAGLVDRIRETLTANRLAPSRLRVEITEDLLADDVDGAIEILHQLQDVGVGLALDDFGTGYSSLSHLRMLPVDAIKIAKPFVDDLDSSLEQQAFVTAIITLGRNLRKFSIAEGIERPEQLDVLRAIGCDAGQGFLFARPMDEDGFTTWLHLSAKRNRAPGPSSAGVAPRTFAAVGGDRTGGG